MARRNYQEGDWFAVTLREGGGYAAGIIARANPDGVLLGYFFGPRRSEVPSIRDVVGLSAHSAVLVGNFGDLRLLRRVWPIIGCTEGWDRRMWPMPVFGRFEELTGRSFKMFYDDHDPNRLVREVQVPADEAAACPEDGLMGAGFVEKRLTRLLK